MDEGAGTGEGCTEGACCAQGVGEGAPPTALRRDEAGDLRIDAGFCLQFLRDVRDVAFATVDEDGKVTALKEGSTTITAEANDGNGALATCTLTVTKDEEEPTPSTSDKNSASTGEGNSDKDDASGCGSVVGFGTAGVVTLLAGAAIVSKRKKN